MALNDTQKDRLAQRMREMLTGRKCDWCGHVNWGVSGSLHQLTEFDAEALQIVGGARVPVVVVGCHNCGNTRMFNAIALGLIDPNTGRWVDGE